MAVAQIRSRGRLPHWETEHGIYFVTFRLADSLPKGVVASLEIKFSREADGRRKKSREIETYIDRGGGACYLKTPAVADLVADTLRRFDGVRYRLFAWCIMPNHLHVVFQPRGTFRLKEILHSWKSYSGLAANKPWAKWAGVLATGVLRSFDSGWGAVYAGGAVYGGESVEGGIGGLAVGLCGSGFELR